MAQAQLTTRFVAVVGIEHFRDRFRQFAVRHRARIVAFVEALKVELVRSLGLPQTQCRRQGAVVAHYGHVVSLREHGLSPMVNHLQVARLIPAFLNLPSKANRKDAIGTWSLPRIARDIPHVGDFLLFALDNPLAEKAVLVADAIAYRRQFERRHAVEEAGGQAAKASVAQTGIGLLLL